MSRAWMPWYIGDYLRDTGHLTTEQHGAYLLLIAHCWQHGSIPAAPNERAAIAKLTPSRWKIVGPPVARFFNDDGTQNRVTKEITRTERAVMQRQQAGRRGGQKSGLSRAIKRGEALADEEAKTKRELKREGSGSFDFAEAKPQAKTKLPRTNHKEDITTSESVAARASPVGSVEENQNNPAGLLATALPAGALARPPDAEQVAKRPEEFSKSELEAMYERRRKQSQAPPGGAPSKAVAA